MKQFYFGSFYKGEKRSFSKISRGNYVVNGKDRNVSKCSKCSKIEIW